MASMSIIDDIFGPFFEASCPIPLDEFKDKCRVATYPGKVNRWLLLRTTRDGATREQVLETVDAVMRKWWSGVRGPAGDVAPTERLGSVRADVGAGEEAWEAFASTQGAPLDTRQSCPFGMTIQTGRASLSSPATSRGEDFFAVYVEFELRAQITNLPWPVWQGAKRVLDPECPVAADWLLDRYWEPHDDYTLSEGSEVPDTSFKGGVKPVLDIGMQIGAGLAVVGLLILGALFLKD